MASSRPDHFFKLVPRLWEVARQCGWPGRLSPAARSIMSDSSRLADHLLAGAVSGSLTRVVTAPLDVLKVRFQLQVEPIHDVRCQVMQGA